jgi:hypothetical protein
MATSDSYVSRHYKLTVEASGDTRSESDITLLTEQDLYVPVTLKVGAVTEAVYVTSAAPVVEMVDSRNQLTLENSGITELPIAGRNLVSLTTLAPGVSGLATMGTFRNTESTAVSIEPCWPRAFQGDIPSLHRLRSPRSRLRCYPLPP